MIVKCFVNSRQCHNFQNDITDSEIYTYLMKQIAPLDSDVDMSALMVITNYEYNFYIFSFCYFRNA